MNNMGPMLYIEELSSIDGGQSTQLQYLSQLVET